MTRSRNLGTITSLIRCGGLFLLVGILASCDSAENGPWYLSLAGKYYGELTLSFGELSLSGFMTASVEQSGSQLTLSGFFHLAGRSQTLAGIAGTVSNTGFFTSSGGDLSRFFGDPQCGALTGHAESINFIENKRLEFVGDYDYQLCGRLSFRAELHRS